MFALGLLELPLPVYYDMSFWELTLRFEGYNIKQRRLADLIRTHAFIIRRSLGGKESLTGLWPLNGDAIPIKPKQMTADEIKAIEDYYNGVHSN